MSVENRRFARIHFRGDTGQASRILGARIIWSNLEVSDVYDLSFKGFAVSRPALVNLNVGSLHSVHIELGEKPQFLIPVKIVWVKEQHVGLEIGDTSAEAHVRLGEFINDKLIGQHLRRIDKQYFAGGETFNYWFQGPNSTSLFVWCDQDDATKVTRIVLELDGEIWEFENRRVKKGENLNARAIQILGQVLVTEFRLKDVIEKVAAQG